MCSPLTGGTSRFPRTPSTGPLRGQAASPPDVRVRRCAPSFVSLRVRVDAALELVGAGPAACALLLVGRDRPRAADAADRAVAGLVQGIEGDLVDADVRPDPLLVPVGQRVHLPDAVARRPLELRRRGAARRLVAADPGNPPRVRRERALERLDLPDVAAAIGVAL